MKTPTDDISPVETIPQENPDQTGLPGLTTWRHVYLFVFGCFLFSVAVLLLLTMVYS